MPRPLFSRPARSSKLCFSSGLVLVLLRVGSRFGLLSDGAGIGVLGVLLVVILGVLGVGLKIFYGLALGSCLVGCLWYFWVILEVVSGCFFWYTSDSESHQ